MKKVIALALALAVSAAFGQYNAMDQAFPIGFNLQSMEEWGLCAVFTSPISQILSSTTIDDFQADESVVDRVALVVEAEEPLVNLVSGWRVSVWESPEAASLSDNTLTANTINTTLVTQGVTYTPLDGRTSLSLRAFLVEIPLRLPVGKGRRWIGVSAVIDTTFFRPVLIADNLTPARLGGDPANAAGVNPGEGFGAGKLIPTSGDAALSVNVAPGRVERLNPAEFRVRLGRTASGNLASLASRDNDYLRVCRFVVPNLTVAPINVELTYRSSLAFADNLQARFWARMSTVGAFQIQIQGFDARRGAWDEVGELRSAIDRTDREFVWTATAPARRFLSDDGTVTLRYLVRQTGPGGNPAWCQELDQAELTIAE